MFAESRQISRQSYDRREKRAVRYLDYRARSNKPYKTAPSLSCGNPQPSVFRRWRMRNGKTPPTLLGDHVKVQSTKAIGGWPFHNFQRYRPESLGRVLVLESPDMQRPHPSSQSLPPESPSAKDSCLKAAREAPIDRRLRTGQQPEY